MSHDILRAAAMFECENAQTLGNVSLVSIDKLRYNMSI